MMLHLPVSKHGGMVAQAVRAVRGDLQLTRFDRAGDRTLAWLLERQPQLTTARQVAAAMGMTYSTLLSRDHRGGRLSIRERLVAVRLLLTSYILALTDEPVGTVALLMHYSTPQSFARHLRLERGVTPTEWRRKGYQAELTWFLGSVCADRAA